MSLLASTKLPAELPVQLQRIDRFWQEYRSLSQPVPDRIQTADSKVGDLDCDVVICGGTLGIFIGCALQLKGWRVVLLEQGQLQGRAQEWNISRKELDALLELDLLSSEELEQAIATTYNPARVGFHGGIELWVKDILNIGVDPVFLLATLKDKFLAAGGKLLEQTGFDRATIHPDGVLLRGTNEITVKARLLLDVMGHFSPIAQQARSLTAQQARSLTAQQARSLTAQQARSITQGNLKPEGVCMVVGSCAQGLPKKDYGDLIYTFAPIQNQCQYFWEAFPARDGRTTYMFTYVDADPQRPSFSELLEDYLSWLPQYQEVDLAEVEFQRMLMGFFPAYQNSPLQTPWSRILQVGDSSGMQSPLSFGGFGALMRHLVRLTEGIQECLTQDFLTALDLRSLQPYQPNLSVTWLFQKSMSVGVGQQVEADRINKLLSTTFTAMQKLGDPVLRPFLQDIVQFPALSQTMLAMAVADPILVAKIVQQVGLGTLIDWAGHFANLGGYSLLNQLEKWIPGQNNSIQDQYRWVCRRNAWRFGSGGDYH
jgi:lycopene cyclase CruP